MTPRLLAQHRHTIPIGPDIGRAAQRQLPASATTRLRGPLRSKLLCVHGGGARYALVEGVNKKVVVKINDVGPLEPGRIIDLNERAMRLFDPTLQRGLIPNVKVTPLRGDHWTPGPIAGKVTASEVATD